MNSDRAPSKIDRIDPALKQAYIERKMTSDKLAAACGMNASYLRRAIKRNPAQPPVKKTALIAVRNAYRRSIANKSAAEIATLAHVSLRTAQRIKARTAKLGSTVPSGTNEPI